LSSYKIIYITLAFLLVKCDVAEVSVLPEYPITIEPLGLLELDELNNAYQQKNNGQLCSTLNEYGFTGFSRILFPNDVNPCTDRIPQAVELSTPDIHLSKAVNAVQFNQEFTNVSSSYNLVLQEALPLYGCTICEGPETNSVPLEWKFTFEPQVIEGMEVSGSEITVFVDVNGVNRIWGNWYEEFYAPDLLNVGYVQAENSIVGLSVDLNAVANLDSVFIINKDDVGDARSFEILPTLNESNELELRKTWKVPIRFIHSDINGLVANVDAVDSQLLRITANRQETNN
jgi:hypothetical protein